MAPHARLRYTGNVNRALSIPELLVPFLTWARQLFDARLNGLLLNWYDAERKHYIGAHRDSTVGLIALKIQFLEGLKEPLVGAVDVNYTKMMIPKDKIDVPPALKKKKKPRRK